MRYDSASNNGLITVLLRGIHGQY